MEENKTNTNIEEINTKENKTEVNTQQKEDKTETNKINVEETKKQGVNEILAALGVDSKEDLQTIVSKYQQEQENKKTMILIKLLQRDLLRKRSVLILQKRN